MSSDYNYSTSVMKELTNFIEKAQLYQHAESKARETSESQNLQSQASKTSKAEELIWRKTDISI